MSVMETLLWGEIPELGSPTFSWPQYGRVGMSYNPDSSGGGDYEPDIRPALKLKREDDEIILILSAIIKEL